MNLSVAELVREAALRKASPDLTVGVVREAAEQIAPEWTGHGTVPPHLVRRCLALAAEIAARAKPGDPSAARAIIQSSGYARITGTRVLEQIEETVRQVRYSYFHTSDAPGERPPFESYEEALEWLARERWNTRLGRLSPEEDQRKIELSEELDRLAAELEDLTGWTVDPQPEPTVTIHYEDSRGRERELSSGRQDSLFTFALWVYRLSLWGGFREVDLVRYLLCGTRPSLPAATIRLESHGGNLLDDTRLRRDQVLVELRTPDLGGPRTKRLIASIDEQWRRSRTTVPGGRLRGADGALYEIMASLGGADRENQPYGFWPEVARRWVAAGNARVTTKALMKRWNKVRSRIPRVDGEGSTSGGE